MRRIILALALLLGAHPLVAQRQWKLVEDLRLGAGDGQNSFAGVGSIAVTPNGNIFVVDLSRPPQIKLFSSTGAFVRAVGRDGGGPGEYHYVDALFAIADGRVVAVDRESKRVIVYAEDGRVIRTTPVQFSSYGGDDWVGTVRADGTVLDRIHVYPTGWRSFTREPPKALQHFLADGQRGDTIRFPGCAQRSPPGDFVVQIPQKSPNGRDGYMQTRVPYLAFSKIAFASDGTAWCAPTDVYSAFHFKVGSPDTLHAIRLNVPAPAIPDSGRRWLDNLLGRATNAADITRPTAQPIISDIRVDASHRLWIRRTATPAIAPSFDLYDPQGKALGTVTSTLRWQRIPLVVGDVAYGLVIGDDDVHYLVRAKLR